MDISAPFLIYGSYGYTGSLIVARAVRDGLRPILCGRDALRLKTQAEQYGLEFHPIILDDSKSLEVTIASAALVLNCAGPFQRTYKPIVDACLHTGRDYLDITGEIAVLEALAARDVEARQAGVMLLPAVGFDVVPTDCLAMHVKQLLPDATQLTLGTYWSSAGFSRGTALTSIEGLSLDGAERLGGKLVRVPLLSKTRQMDFGRGLRTAMHLPLADIVTAYYSTGIPNIETYIVMPVSGLRVRQFMRLFIGLARFHLVQWMLRQIVEILPPGPTAEARHRGRNRLWAEVLNPHGEHRTSRMETPDGYDLTVETALEVVKRVLSGDRKPGFQTPALAYGADFILEFEGVKREDL